MTAYCGRTAMLLSVALSGVIAQAGALDLRGILEKPLSPGAVALLAVHASEPAVAARWSEALKDSRAEVRAAAARAINVTATVSLLPDLAAALSTEADLAAAEEEIQALALGGAQAEEALQAAARREPRFEAALSRAQARRRKLQVAPPAPAPAAVTGARTPDGFPPGLVADVFRVSGCPPGKKEAFHGGQVSYGPEGRPRQVTMMPPAGLKPGCAEAVQALLFLALAPLEGTSNTGRPELVVVPLAPEAIACMGEPSRSGAPSRVGGTVGQLGPIKEPKKVRDLAPWYPAGAKADGVQGMVILEATISPTGCVSSVKLLKGRDPRLDLVSLVSVSQWRYTPTLLGGVPVPVIMTVTVNFRLHY